MRHNHHRIIGGLRQQKELWMGIRKIIIDGGCLIEKVIQHIRRVVLTNGLGLGYQRNQMEAICMM